MACISRINSMKVLIIHRYFWPESISTLPIMFRDVVNFHLENDDTVKVVCGAFEDFQDQYKAEFNSQVKVETFQSDLDRNISLLGRVRNVFRLIKLSRKHLKTSLDYDLVYLVSYPPLFAGIISKYIHLKNKNARTVYIVQDILNYRIPTALGKYIYNQFHKWTLKQMDVVTTLSKSMKTELLSLFSKKRRSQFDQKIHIIPNYSTEKVDLEAALPEKEFDIIYAGNHGHAQNLIHFIDVVALLEPDERPSISFYGAGTAKQKIVSHAEKMKVVISFHDYVSRAEAQLRMSEARFGLVGAVPGLMRYAFPSKLAAYNTAGTAGILMAEKANEISQWIKNEEFGAVIDPVLKTLACNQLREILNGPEGRYKAYELREKSALFYSKENYINRLKEILRIENFDV